MRFRLLAGALLLVAALLVVLSARYEAGPDQPSLVDAAVQGFYPARESTVPRQTQIGIDLVPGWDADLRINGVDIPDDEERKVGGLNQVFFTPGKGEIIESLAPGEVVVTAFIWRPAQGETRENGARSVTWRYRAA